MSYWRNRARPIIARVLAETEGRPESEIRAALRDAYPFGPRSHHPYKIWLSEIKRQRGARQRGPSPEQAARIAEIRAHNEAVG